MVRHLCQKVLHTNSSVAVDLINVVAYLVSYHSSFILSQNYFYKTIIKKNVVALTFCTTEALIYIVFMTLIFFSICVVYNLKENYLNSGLQNKHFNMFIILVD